MGVASPPRWWTGVVSTVGLPAVVAVLTLLGTLPVATFFQPDARAVDALGVALLLAGPAALVVRRRYPPAVLAVAAAAVVGYFLLGYPYGPGVFLAVLVALTTAVTAGHRVAAYALTAATYAALLVFHLIRNPGSAVLAGAAGWLAWLAAVIAGGELWRSHRERQAQSLAVLAEAERRRASEERVRIARELHDVLGHHVSLINVQAGVALYLIDEDPEQARRALAAIKQSSRELLREMRVTLGLLRGIDEEPPRHPAPGMSRLDELVADCSAVGLAVRVRIEGTARELPAGVDLAAYRIVQEALTNTRRHADAGQASVLVGYRDGGVTVQIDDDGAGGAIGSEGSGLPGMRERADALGGTFTAGPRPGGGFRVRAELPVAELATGPSSAPAP